MTERQEIGPEYSEAWMGTCLNCERPATVRVYEDFVLCALHHLAYEIREETDEDGLAVELIAGWHSIANMYDNSYLIRMFNIASEELRERSAAAERRQAQLDRVEYESAPNEEIHREMGRKAAEANAEAKPERGSGRAGPPSIQMRVDQEARSATSAQAATAHRSREELLTDVIVALDSAAGEAREEGSEDLARRIEEELIPFVRAEREQAGKGGAEQAPSRDVVSFANRLLAEAAEVLGESVAPTEEQREAELEARQAIAEAQLVIAKQLRPRTSGAEPESGEGHQSSA